MLNCVIHYRDEQAAVFCLEDFPELDSVNIGGDKRCEVCLADKWNAAPVLVSLTADRLGSRGRVPGRRDAAGSGRENRFFCPCRAGDDPEMR